jgi:hypothetical protein
MKSINYKFQKAIKDNPYLGYFYCLKIAITNQHFSQKNIAKALNDLVPKEDYGSENKKDLIDELMRASKTPRGG